MSEETVERIKDTIKDRRERGVADPASSGD
jgi:hypothetical protein